MERDTLDALGAALAYPEPGFRERLEAGAAAGGPLGELVEALRGLDLAELQELYTRTFDLNPVCALEVGWHLYGEAYERGRFLVRMRDLLRRLDLPEGTELPDHLTAVLPALGRLDPEEAAPFAAAYLMPALAKMREGLAGKDNPYEKALDAVERTVAKIAAIAATPARESEEAHA
jgi:nitrate reductase molybdenum cofactor assembly chaperone NarJ/NarW